MSEREKQNDDNAEMLEIIENARKEYANDVTDHTESEYIREGLLNAGFRKQGECENVSRYRGSFECSACHWEDMETYYADSEFAFCPGCGKKVKGGAHE